MSSSSSTEEVAIYFLMACKTEHFPIAPIKESVVMRCDGIGCEHETWCADPNREELKKATQRLCECCGPTIEHFNTEIKRMIFDDEPWTREEWSRINWEVIGGKVHADMQLKRALRDLKTQKNQARREDDRSASLLSRRPILKEEVLPEFQDMAKKSYEALNPFQFVAMRRYISFFVLEAMAKDFDQFVKLRVAMETRKGATYIG